MTPLWKPDKDTIDASNMQAFIRFVNDQHTLTLSDYDSLYQWSINDRPTFWQSLAEFFNVHFFHHAFATLTEETMLDAHWFPGSALNYAEHLLRHRSDNTALIFRSEQGQRQVYSYEDLYQAVSQAQKGLQQLGISRGDRVAAFMPNCPETVIVMIAATALGAIWSSCSPDFGLQGVLDRFGQIEPKLLLTVDGYYYNGKKRCCLEKVQKIGQQISSLQKTVLLPFASDLSTINKPENSLWFDEFMNNSSTTVSIEPVPFNHPLFIMYSSGTTGAPKCIVHGHGGTLLQHVKELGLHTDIHSTDTLFYFTTCGWMMWNWAVSSLALGATLVLYDGSPFYPEPKSLMDMADEENVSIFGTSAKYLAALEKAGVKPATSHSLDSLKAILSTGSPLLHESYDYVYREIKPDVRLSSISGGTDIISCFALGNPILPVYRGELQCPGLGMEVDVVDVHGNALPSEKGELVCKSSFPSMPIGFWNDPDNRKYHAAYFNTFPEIWAHGDFAQMTEHKGLIIHGRADAVLNPGGVRIGTAEIYRQVEKVDAVLESIAVGQEWGDDTRVILFVKLRENLTLNETLENQIKAIIRENTTPRHVPEKILQVQDIPRTISGKVVELAVREVIHNRPVLNKDALANPEALNQFKQRSELNT